LDGEVTDELGGCLAVFDEGRRSCQSAKEGWDRFVTDYGVGVEDGKGHPGVLGREHDWSKRVDHVALIMPF
jgi:hypothetical protein